MSQWLHTEAAGIILASMLSMLKDSCVLNCDTLIQNLVPRVQTLPLQLEDTYALHL